MGLIGAFFFDHAADGFEDYIQIQPNEDIPQSSARSLDIVVSLLKVKTPVPPAVYSELKLFNIFLAKGSFISVCRGTASMIPVLGLIQRECELPSLLR